MKQKIYRRTKQFNPNVDKTVNLKKKAAITKTTEKKN